MMKLRTFSLMLVCLPTLLCNGPAMAQDAAISTRPKEIDAKTRSAIDKALAYLARSQRRDGSWRSGGSSGSYPVAMTSLAGLALMAGGNTPVEGKYSVNVRRAVDFLLKCSDRKTGLISRMHEESRPMYGHGFAMLFLAEAYGMERNRKQQEAIKQVLQKAVELTGKAQSKDGGWYYGPNDQSDEGSVTVTQIQALRAARNAGIKVPKKVIDRATNYIKICQNADGGISYSYSPGGGGSSRPAITAAAVAVMYNAGEYENPVAVGCLKYVKRHLKSSQGRSFSGHYAYATLYAAQAMYLSGETDWQDYYKPVFKHYVETQDKDGSWDGDHVGPVYGTAIGLITLQLPLKYLPVLQR